MKKILFFFFILLGIISCSSRDMLDKSTCIIYISSNSQTSSYIQVNKVSTVQFSAKLISPNGKILSTSPKWSVSDNESSITPNGLYMVPRNISNDRRITITASFNGISSSGNYLLVKELPSEVDIKNRYYMYADINPSIMNFKPETISNADAGSIGIINYNARGFDFSESSFAYEGGKSLKLSYKYTPYGTGVFFQFNDSKDLKNYSKIVFSVYTDGSIDSLDFGIRSNGMVQAQLTSSIFNLGAIKLNPGWQNIFLDLSDFSEIDKSRIEQIVFLNTILSFGDIYIDNVYFEK